MIGARNNNLVNRELSWLEFNQRVLDEGSQGGHPLLEQLKFLAITASNLDEFFMVRVGGLQGLSKKKPRRKDASGMTATEQLEAIGDRVRKMVQDQYLFFSGTLEPALAKAGVRRVDHTSLTVRQQQVLDRLVENEIYPILTPMAVTAEQECPLLPGNSLCLCVRLSDEQRGAARFAWIPFGPTGHRFLTLPSDGGYEYILLEDVVVRSLERFFPGEEVLECVPFRITRNADLSVREDAAADLLSDMQEVLDARKASHCVRLEISDGVSEKTRSFLTEKLTVTDENVQLMPGPLGLADFMQLTDLPGFDTLQDKPWPAVGLPELNSHKSLFEVLAEKDLLLCHPFESFDPVTRLVEEAAEDPDVLAIKQTLYRTSRDSPIVEALGRAAENGKHVTVIVELKARFDEASNITQARNLEQSGAQVIYGIHGLKTHAKVCIVVRREPRGIQRYVHFGTGNYNENTSRLYTDISYLTCDEELGSDATSFFNTITGYSQPLAFRRIEAAPIGLRERLLELIGNEAERKRQGQDARILAKMNSLVDPAIIEALYQASQAGVRIELNVRGICCLRPGVEGLSENITVTSIVDRFLEHSRVLYFHQGGSGRVFISSADWMPRNLDRRIELLVPIDDPEAAARLLLLLETCMADDIKGRRIQADGGYVAPAPVGDSSAERRSQRVLYEAVRRALKRSRESRREVFVPHRAPKPDSTGT